MTLRELQLAFVAAVLDPDAAVPFEVVPPAGLDAKAALDIYRGDYAARMREALEKNYEATWLLLGDEDFDAYAADYVVENPSTFRNLTKYGDAFPEFLAAAGAPEAAVQMAIIERRFWELFHAPDSERLLLSPGTLERQRFRLPRLELFRANLRLDLLWRHREQDAAALAEIDLQEDCCLALYKASEAVRFHAVSAVVFAVLEELKEVGFLTELSPRDDLSPESWAEVLRIIENE
jgi:hypothetical protein